MIIYGTKAKVIKTEYIAEPCPNCNTLNSLQMNILQKWAHVFWIPFFPIGKTGISQCTHCQQVLVLKNMPPMLRMSYDNMKSDTKIPVWTFSGIGVIIVIAIVINISDRQTAKKVTQMIPSLKKDDILQIKLKDNAYTLAKVNRVKGDSVFLFANSFQIDRATDINKLKDKDYVTTEDTLTVADLKEMNKNERILDIERH
jgi:hypothetical protein